MSSPPLSVIPAEAGNQFLYVIPAEAGIQRYRDENLLYVWIPACAGMTFILVLDSCCLLPAYAVTSFASSTGFAGMTDWKKRLVPNLGLH